VGVLGSDCQRRDDPQPICRIGSLSVLAVPSSTPMENDWYWATRTISEAMGAGYSHLRATCSGCGRITDIPWALLLRPPRITADSFIGNIHLRCEKCGDTNPKVAVRHHGNTQGYGKPQDGRNGGRFMNPDYSQKEGRHELFQRRV